MSTKWIYWVVSAVLAVSTMQRAVHAVAPPRIILEMMPDNRVRLVWDNTGQAVVLEEASTLAPPVPWQAARETVTLDGNRFSAVLSFGDTGRFFRLNDQGPGLTTFSSSPASGETGIAVTRETILTFNQPLAADTLITTTNLYAEFAGRRILSRVELSSDRRKATLFYLENLPASARINVTFDASTVRDVFGRLVDADANRVEGGIGTIEFDTLGITPVPGTAISGRVFASQLVPNPTNATLSVNQPLQRSPQWLLLLRRR